MQRTLPIGLALALALSACDSGGGNESAPGTTDIADNGTAAQSLAVDSANEATDASTTEFAQETTGNTSPAGEDGVDGDAGPIGPAGPAGLIWRGEWAADTNFVARDAVSFEGSSWVAIASSVSVEPDSDEMAWSLLARKGDEGEQGPAGRAGAQGRPGNATVGATGAVGATGPAGPQGIAGAPGVQGDVGPAGARGAQGPAGDAGADGEAGMTWIGAFQSGATYTEDDVVEYNGSSYIALVDTDGSQAPTDTAHWALVAERGADGAVGPAGATGPAGLPGAEGAQGPQGLQGPEGLQGAVGPIGNTGATGPEGPTGPQGIAGANGVDGEDGVDGAKGMNWQGPYTPGTLYVADDVVEFNGASYIALQDNEGEYEPTAATHWELVADRGADGAAGATGATGPAGAPGVDGAQGPQGIQGPVGPIGNTGATGAEGPTGPQGIAGANGVDGEDGVDGAKGMNWQGPYTPGTLYVADDVVEFNGASYIALQDNEGEYEPTAATHWELVADRGADGAAGATGATGPAGIPGVDGAQGPQGIQGPVGPIGNTGATGPEGPTGPQGLAGANGVDGEDGVDGAKGMNWQGPYTPGTLYVADDVVEFNGASYIALQDNEGEYEPTAATHWELVADRGLDGAVGATGATGPAGAPGVDGTQGPQGIQGPVGPIGNTGATGPGGPTGPQGLAGVNGIDGEDGADGAKGMNWQGSYTPGTLYVADDVVEFNGASYIALQDNEGEYEPTAETHWELVADRGLAGVVGAKGMNWQGQYFSGAGYVADDVVEFNGSSYIALRDTEGEFDPTATTHWELLAERGLDGAVGAPGVDGAPGPQGIQGPAGPAGSNGATGPEGPQGPSGANGVDGEDGARGMNWQGPFQLGTNYLADDAVEYNGSSYIALVDTDGTPDPTTTTHWDVIAEAPTTTVAAFEYEFAGFSNDQVSGDAGLLAMANACQTTYGEGSRMAFSLEVFEKPGTEPLSDTAWVQATPTADLSIDMITRLTDSRLSCRGWSAPGDSFGGLSLDGETLKFMTQGCNHTRRVACSVPVAHKPQVTFVGFSGGQVVGDAGLLGMSSACDATFGEGSRIAYTHEVFEASHVGPYSDTAWVQPSFLYGGVSDQITRLTSAGLSCSGWSSSTETPSGGLSLDGETLKFMTQGCNQTRRVACSAPY